MELRSCIDDDRGVVDIHSVHGNDGRVRNEVHPVVHHGVVHQHLVPCRVPSPFIVQLQHEEVLAGFHEHD